MFVSLNCQMSFSGARDSTGTGDPGSNLPVPARSAVRKSGPGLVLTLVAFAVLSALPARATSPLDASALDTREPGGRLEGELNGRNLPFPLLKSDYQVQIDGDLASVTLTQTFANPTNQPMNARYLFPLNREAAVHSMLFQVGHERIRGVIQQKQEARQTFETAKQEGKGAALLEQHRPNMFTQDLANLMPGQPVTVTLEYVHPLPRRDDSYELVLPLVVGPRYIPADQTLIAEDAPATLLPATLPGEEGAEDDAVLLSQQQTRAEPEGQRDGDGWQMEPLPLFPPVAGLDLPASIAEDRVSISISLAAGQTLQGLDSPTHRVTITDKGENRRAITLASGRTIDNRDFVLRYRLAGKAPGAGITAATGSEDGYLSLLLEPPLLTGETPVQAREVVFLLDCSGSMGGAPMDASKAFMREALKALRPDDSFRIIRFSDSATEFSRQPLPATRNNIARGLTYTMRLQGSGGTEMMSGVRQALGDDVEKGKMRIVVFLTDGYIGNDLDVLRAVEDMRGDARIYAFGVGSGVNRFLLEELARTGHGFARFLDPANEDMNAVAARLAERINAPVMTGLSIDWGKLDVQEVYPSVLPDLFAGDSLRVMARYHGGGEKTIRVWGEMAGRNGQIATTATLPKPAASGKQSEKGGNPALAVSFARKAIEDRMHRMTLPLALRENGESDSDLEAQITALGLEHSLVTNWTSFVAVTETVLNPEPDSSQDSQVPLPAVDGVSENAYPGQRGQRAAAPGQQTVPHIQQAHLPMAAGLLAGAASSFGGKAAPEPETLGGLALMAMAGLFALRRRRRQVRGAAC